MMIVAICPLSSISPSCPSPSLVFGLTWIGLPCFAASFIFAPSATAINAYVMHDLGENVVRNLRRRFRPQSMCDLRHFGPTTDCNR